MPDFSRRSTEAELMDDPAAPPAELRQNLRELEVINTWLGGYSVILAALRKMTWPADRPLSVMDLGSGGGDTLRAIHQWAVRSKRPVQLTGIDLNPVMTAYATEHSDAAIRFRTMDIFDPALENERPDIVICSLFCHHFEDESLVRLLQRMKALARQAVVINDLHRHWLAYYSIAAITSVFSKTYMVQNDAKLSVARAFTRKDWQHLLMRAHIERYELAWRWAFRWLVVIPA